MKSISIFFFFCAILSACTVTKPAIEADTILYGAQFFTATDGPEIQALAITGNRIVACGTEADIMKLKGAHTQVLDLNGRFVMPGLIEGHGHFQALGRSLIEPNLMFTQSYEEVVRILAQCAEFKKNGEWLSGRGWHQEKWDLPLKGAVEGYPTHHALSAATPHHPTILGHASGHALLANARAMELAGVDKSTKDPVGGRIIRDSEGNPTGVFEENAMSLIQTSFDASIKALTRAEQLHRFKEAAEKASAEALRFGVTSFHDAGSTLEELEMYHKLMAETPIDTRLWVMALQPQVHDFASIAQQVFTDTVQYRLKIGAVKAYFDGALGSYGAWLLEPYSDKPGHFGQNTTAIDTLKALAQFCADQKLQFCVHAIGDRANREVLNVMEPYCTKNKKLRWRIEHAQHIDPSDMQRFAQLGVIASMQPIHCTSDQPFVVKRLGFERSQLGAYPWRSLIEKGVRFCGGTDVPVESIDPFANIYAAVTRRRLDNGASLFPEQSLSRKEALLAYTAWNAYAAGEEHVKGALEVGLLADLVVLDQNLLTCAPIHIPHTKVMTVFFGGKQIKLEQ